MIVYFRASLFSTLNRMWIILVINQIKIHISVKLLKLELVSSYNYKNKKPVLLLVLWLVLTLFFFSFFFLIGVSCDSCLKGNFRGKRYKCLVCYDYDLCANCYEAGATTTRHSNDHPVQCILTKADFGKHQC